MASGIQSPVIRFWKFDTHIGSTWIFILNESHEAALEANRHVVPEFKLILLTHSAHEPPLKRWSGMSFGQPTESQKFLAACRIGVENNPCLKHIIQIRPFPSISPNMGSPCFRSRDCQRKVNTHKHNQNTSNCCLQWNHPKHGEFVWVEQRVDQFSIVYSFNLRNVQTLMTFQYSDWFMGSL